MSGGLAIVLPSMPDTAAERQPPRGPAAQSNHPCAFQADRRNVSDVMLEF